MVDQSFLNLCSQANTKVDEAERRFSAWLSSVGSAYSDAWLTHTKFLKDIGTKTKLTQDLILGAGLALIPGAVGGVIGDAMKISTKVTSDTISASILRNKMPLVADVMIDFAAGTPSIDAMKDLAKWGLRSGAIVGQAGITVPMGAIFTKFPTDPLQWQNNINERVQTELADVTKKIADWQDKVNKGDASFQANFNPVDAVNAALQVSSANLAGANSSIAMASALVDLKPVNKPEVSAVFQAGFLVTWVNKYGFQCYAENSQVSWSGWGIFGSRGVKGDIVDYGTKLKIGRFEAFVDDCVSRGVQENNQRAIQSGHGLI